MEVRALDPKTGEKLASVTFNATTIAGHAASVSLLAGDGQISRPGMALAAPLQAKVTDRFGNPVPAAVVTFVATPPDGAAIPANASTDPNGSATVTWMLGTAPGAQSRPDNPSAPSIT